MFLLADTLGTAGFLIMLAVALSFLLRRSYRYFGRKKREKNDYIVHVPRPKSSRWSSNLDSPEQVTKFEVQLQETMRELSAQLDNKMVCLQVLLRQADEKIKRLEALAESLPSVTADGAPLDPRRAAKLASEAVSLDAETERIYTLADEGFSPVTIAHRVARPLKEIETLLRARAAE